MYQTLTVPRPRHHRNTVLLLSCLFLSACVPASAQDYREIIDGFADRAHFNGVILVASDDSVLYAQSYGHADFEGDVPTSMDTRYQLGSISKWISSLVVLKLVDQGTLSLNVPIGTYLPETREGVGRRVTLHHLVTHTSGVPNDFVSAYENDPSMINESLSMNEAVSRYASGDLLFAPGSQFDYSHSNWILVKAIVERTTGQSFEDNVRKLLTEPLGLADTGVFIGTFSSVPRSAFGYETVEPVPERFSISLPEYSVCMGGLYSTAADLLTLLNGLYSGAVLSEDSLYRLTTIAVDGEGYAYGGRVNRMNLGGGAETVLWLTGSNGPFKSRMSRVLTNGLTVITLSNTGTSPEKTGSLTEQVLKSVVHPTLAE